MFEIKIFVAQSLLCKHETGQSSVFNHFIETKLLERFHSSNLVVNHPVGRKRVKSGQWWTARTASVSQRTRRCRDRPASGLWPGPSLYSGHTVAVQQPVDILRSVSAPLIQRYLDLSGSDIWSIIQVRQFLISRYFSPLTFRTYQSGLHRASALMRSLYLFWKGTQDLNVSWKTFIFVCFIVLSSYRFLGWYVRRKKVT